jgi:hypothetical protein
MYLSANGSCSTNGLDVTYLVNFFKGGPAPIRPDCGQVILKRSKSKVGDNEN